MAQHPQTDGQMENAHHTLEYTLCCVLTDKQMGESKWADIVGAVELAMNTAIIASTCEAPAKLDLESYPTCQSIPQSIARQLINQLP